MRHNDIPRLLEKTSRVFWCFVLDFPNHHPERGEGIAAHLLFISFCCWLSVTSGNCTSPFSGAGVLGRRESWLQNLLGIRSNMLEASGKHHNPGIAWKCSIHITFERLSRTVVCSFRRINDEVCWLYIPTFTTCVWKQWCKHLHATFEMPWPELSPSISAGVISATAPTASGTSSTSGEKVPGSKTAAGNEDLALDSPTHLEAVYWIEALNLPSSFIMHCLHGTQNMKEITRLSARAERHTFVG